MKMSHKYNPGDAVLVDSMYHGERKGLIENAYYKSGIPFYKISIDDLGETEVREGRIKRRLSGVKMDRFGDMVDKELKKRMSMTSDEYNESFTPPKGEITNNDQQQTVKPKAKSKEEMNENPNDLVNDDVVDEMGAKSEA